MYAFSITIQTSTRVTEVSYTECFCGWKVGGDACCARALLVRLFVRVLKKKLSFARDFCVVVRLLCVVKKFLEIK